MRKKEKKSLLACVSYAEYIRTEADYMAHKLNTITLRARLLLGRYPSLSFVEKSEQLYAFVSESSIGIPVAEKISGNVLDIESSNSSVSRAEYIRTEADYMARKLHTIALSARLLLGKCTSLSFVEQSRQLYEFALQSSVGNSVSERISRDILGVEPYNSSGQPVYDPFPAPIGLEW